MLFHINNYFPVEGVLWFRIWFKFVSYLLKVEKWLLFERNNICMVMRVGGQGLLVTGDLAKNKFVNPNKIA